MSTRPAPGRVGEAATFPGEVTGFLTKLRRNDNTFSHTVVLQLVAICLLICGLTSCAFFSTHRFTSPGKDWQARTGQLMYRNGTVSVAGDVLVRFSKTGDFELTFSKGPGMILFTIQQDATFAQVKSSLARLSWSGPTANAPAQLRGWLSLRDKIISAPNQAVVRQTVGNEKFVFRFSAPQL